MSDRTLAQIIYRVAKLAVTQLEQAYGFGKRQEQQYVEQVVVIKSVDTSELVC